MRRVRGLHDAHPMDPQAGNPRRRTASDRHTWLKAHAIDVIALPLSAVVVARFWFEFFGLHDPRVLMFATTAYVCEAARRGVIACHTLSRPSAFCDDRRLDILTAILLAVGPWPIAQVFSDGFPLAQISQLLSLPEWAGLVAGLAAVSMAAQRLAATLAEVTAQTVHISKSEVRSLKSEVPAF
jgi:hypothetical protein